MIFSTERLDDIKLRQQHLEVIQVALRLFQKTGEKKFLEHAKAIGHQSNKIKDFIEKGDYSKRDSIRQRIR